MLEGCLVDGLSPVAFPSKISLPVCLLTEKKYTSLIAVADCSTERTASFKFFSNCSNSSGLLLKLMSAYL